MRVIKSRSNVSRREFDLSCFREMCDTPIVEGEAYQCNGCRSYLTIAILKCGRMVFLQCHDEREFDLVKVRFLKQIAN